MLDSYDCVAGYNEKAHAVRRAAEERAKGYLARVKQSGGEWNVYRKERPTFIVVCQCGMQTYALTTLKMATSVATMDLRRHFPDCQTAVIAGIDKRWRVYMSSNGPSIGAEHMNAINPHDIGQDDIDQLVGRCVVTPLGGHGIVVRVDAKTGMVHTRNGGSSSGFGCHQIKAVCPVRHC